MAKINVKDKSIEVETRGYSSPDFEVKIGYETPETKDTDYVKQATISLSKASSRSDCTFAHIQEEINNFMDEYREETEILKVTSLRVLEKETIKSGWNTD